MKASHPSTGRGADVSSAGHPAPAPDEPAAAEPSLALAGDGFAFYRANPDAIEARPAALGEEWDIERVLELNAATLSLVGAGLSMLRRRPMLGVPGMVAALLLQYAVRGISPPIALLRRLGFRSAAEIAGECAALRALRGEAAVPPAPERRPPLVEAIARKGLGALSAIRRCGPCPARLARRRLMPCPPRSTPCLPPRSSASAGSAPARPPP
ncbi:hypothetical protein BH23PSE1_BH23PSE1_15230 [soil metagenome]